jgi:DNA-binding NarL/FixJ family response regulator
MAKSVISFYHLLLLAKSGRGGNVMFKTMLVEDSPPFRKLLKDSLKNRFPFMDISEAGGGVEAVQKIGSYPPNLIFMDIQLPGENGLELTRKIKADYPNIIIIVLTDYDLPEYREAAIRYKADYFFAKDEMVTDGIFKLVKSILLEKGFNSNGSKANAS